MSRSLAIAAIMVMLLGAATVYSQQKAGKKKADMEHMAPREAVAVLIPTEGSDVKGVITLTQEQDYVHVHGKVVNLTPGKHGFHIHQFGDLRDPKGLSAGGHYNPTGDPHGGLEADRRHVGDFGNIEANEQGVADVDLKVPGLQVHFVIGRGMVVHAGEDDLTSQPSGDAGDRAAVGVIGIAQVEEAAHAGEAPAKKAKR